jgi:dolichyl-phosphate-mannose--protein O-mannosyl transferase
LGQRVINGNYYGATKSYEASMFNNKELDYSLFPNALRDNIRYSKQYNNNVPKLNLNDPKENGSKPLGWPLGIKSINYRWDKVGNKVSYIYLQGNPIVWLAGLFGVLFSLIFTIANTLLRSKIKNGATFYFMSVFVTLYLAYMGGILTIDRVMYLYHYLVPLTFSLILLFLVFSYLLSKKENNRSLPFFLVLLQLIVLSGFLFFSPLTYGSPLDANQFSYREWLSFWHLKSIR